MNIFYTKGGTCCKQIIFEVKNNILTDLKFINGCSGNLQAIARLTCGKHIDEIIAITKDIQCKNNTSCPDQLAIALLEYKARQKRQLKKV